MRPFSVGVALNERICSKRDVRESALKKDSFIKSRLFLSMFLPYSVKVNTKSQKMSPFEKMEGKHESWSIQAIANGNLFLCTLYMYIHCIILNVFSPLNKHAGIIGCARCNLIGAYFTNFHISLDYDLQYF